VQSESHPQHKKALLVKTRETQNALCPMRQPCHLFVLAVLCNAA
jgi:hypothetical protein